MEDLVQAVQGLQNQVQQQQTENQLLRDRITNFELQQAQQAAQQAAVSPSHHGGGVNPDEILRALQGLPEAISRMNRPKGLIDPKGLGKPTVLGDDADAKFRLWAIKLEDYVAGVFGGRCREVLEWSAGMDAEVTQTDIDNNFGMAADLNDQWDEVDEPNSQLYTVLRATTEGNPFDLVENCPTGRGLEAWRLLHRRFDPATGSRKRVMLQALTNPERASYESLQAALERWKALRSRYDRKKDQFGIREALPESLAMNALEKLVPKDLETHLMLNYTRFRTFDEMEQEVINFIEAKTGSRMVVSSNFAKPSNSNGPVAMDVDSLVRAVSGTLSSLAKGKGGGKPGNNQKPGGKFEGTCDHCGKPGHKKAQCWHRDPNNKGKASSRSSSASPKKVRFEGKCDNCGKVGHKKAQCWQPSGGKGRGGDKQKGKQKGSANSLDNPEPEPPADAGGLDLCTITSSPTPSRTSRVSTSRMSRVTDIPYFEEEGEESRAASDREASVASTVNSLDEGWIKCNLDTGASVTVFPRRMFNNVDEPNDVRLKTASGEIIRGYGTTSIRGKDEKGIGRKLTGQVTEVHKILVSAGALHKKGFSTWIGPGGGCIIPLKHPINDALGVAYAAAIGKHGDEGIIPLYEENGVYNFYINDLEDVNKLDAPATPDEEPPEKRAEMKLVPQPTFAPAPRATGSDAPMRSRSPMRHRPVCAVEGDDPEGDAGDDQMQVRGDEVEEPVEARRANPGWTPKSPTDRERAEHESSGHAVYRSWCEECIKATGMSHQHRRIDHSEDLVDTVTMDYYYMGEEDGAKPYLVAQDRRTGMMMSTSLREIRCGRLDSNEALGKVLGRPRLQGGGLEERWREGLDRTEKSCSPTIKRAGQSNPRGVTKGRFKSQWRS